MTENGKDQVLILDLTINEIESMYLKGVAICWKQIKGFGRNGFTEINNWEKGFDLREFVYVLVVAVSKKKGGTKEIIAMKMEE